MSRVELSPRSRGPLRCVYCHDDVDRQRLLACQDCSAVYHDACIREQWQGHAPRCATRGCRAALVVAAAVVPSTTSLPRPPKKRSLGPGFLAVVLLGFMVAGFAFEIPALLTIAVPLLALMAHSASRTSRQERLNRTPRMPGPESVWTHSM